MMFNEIKGSYWPCTGGIDLDACIYYKEVYFCGHCEYMKVYYEVGDTDNIVFYCKLYNKEIVFDVRRISDYES